MLLTVVLAVTGLHAASVVLGGVKYSTLGSETASARIDNRNNRLNANIVVREKVNIGGQMYTVTEIETKGFEKCKYATEIWLPSTITKIGANAFKGCTALRKVTLPEEAVMDFITFSGRVKNGPFENCPNLREIANIDCVSLNTLEQSFYNCQKTPAALTVTDYVNSLVRGDQTASTSRRRGTRRSSDAMTAMSPIDNDIPAGSLQNANTLVLIFGNENYGNEISAVQYAANDAAVFARYCERTLGIPKENIRALQDATYMQMKDGLAWLKRMAGVYKDSKLNVIFYYAGHGMPNEKSGQAYLMPVDASDSNQEGWLPVADIYAQLGAVGAKSTVVLLDACFSGSGRDNNAVKTGARAMGIRAKKQQPVGNMLVLTASSDSQIANPYADMGHGVFTYHLLEKLNQTKGDVTYGELFDHISQSVPRTALKTFDRIQTPTATPSGSMVNNWESVRVGQ